MAGLSGGELKSPNQEGIRSCPCPCPCGCPCACSRCCCAAAEGECTGLLCHCASQPPDAKVWTAAAEVWGATPAAPLPDPDLNPAARSGGCRRQAGAVDVELAEADVSAAVKGEEDAGDDGALP